MVILVVELKWLKQFGSGKHLDPKDSWAKHRGSLELEGKTHELGVYWSHDGFGFRTNHPSEKDVVLFADSEHGLHARYSEGQRGTYNFRDLSPEEKSHLKKVLSVAVSSTEVHPGNFPHEEEHELLLKALKNSLSLF